MTAPVRARRARPATARPARRLAAVALLTASTCAIPPAAEGASRKPTQRALAASTVAAPGTTVVEAESLTLPEAKGRAFSDTSASGRRALLLWTNAAVTIRPSSTPVEVVLRMRGDQCSGAPRVRVQIGTRIVRTLDVPMRVWTTQRVAIPAALAADAGRGAAISVGYVNDVPGISCDRNLRLDWVAVRTAMPSTPAPNPTPIVTTVPVPAPAKTPSPNPLPAVTIPLPQATPVPTATPTPLAQPPVATPVAVPPPVPVPTPSLAPAPALPATSLFVDDTSAAAQQARSWASTRPADAALLRRIAAQPTAVWLGGWSGDVGAAADGVLDRAAGRSTVVFTLYNVPARDCGQYSAGGLSATAYRAWIDRLAAGIAGRAALVILEPDALVLTDCLSADGVAERYALLRHAVETLSAGGTTKVYLDAGHAGWKSAAEVSTRLGQAGIAGAAGFALNTSNFGSTASQVAYGRDVAGRVGGKPFVIDTSRNGNGAADGGAWCNPAGRALGERPTLQTGLAGVDAFLWIKRPGESDGACNGGPAAGQWWADYALGLARNAHWSS